MNDSFRRNSCRIDFSPQPRGSDPLHSTLPTPPLPGPCKFCFPRTFRRENKILRFLPEDFYVSEQSLPRTAVVGLASPGIKFFIWLFSVPPVDGLVKGRRVPVWDLQPKNFYICRPVPDNQSPPGNRGVNPKEIIGVTIPPSNVCICIHIRAGSIRDCWLVRRYSAAELVEKESTRRALLFFSENRKKWLSVFVRVKFLTPQPFTIYKKGKT